MISFGLFGCRSWFFWKQDWSINLWGPTGKGQAGTVGVLTWGPKIGVMLNLDALGTVMLFLAVIIGTYFVVFVNVKTANFLIETEGELRKVTWPEVKPWFKMSTEIWGSSYVVIFLLFLLAATIFVWDQLLQFLAGAAFYKT